MPSDPMPSLSRGLLALTGCPPLPSLNTPFPLLPSYLTATASPGAVGAAAAVSGGGVAEFKTTLMHVLEALCQQTELVLMHYQVGRVGQNRCA